MPRLLRLLAGSTVAASLSLGLLPEAALSASKAKIKAFNPRPDSPSKRAMQRNKSLGGPDTKGSWKRIHEVDEKSKSKGGTKSLPAVQKSKNQSDHTSPALLKPIVTRSSEGRLRVDR